MKDWIKIDIQLAKNKGLCAQETTRNITDLSKDFLPIIFSIREDFFPHIVDLLMMPCKSPNVQGTTYIEILLPR